MLEDGLFDIPAGKIAVVITHLEMTAPAPTRDIALPEGITFRQVAPDLEWYRDIFDRVGAPWLWTARRVLDDAALMAVLTDPLVALYTLSRDGRDEALLELDFREDSACELAYFGLTPPLIGTGAGRYLMDQAIRLAWSAPIRRFHVHTCTNDSPHALEFYMRSGFIPHRRQIEIEDDPRLLGILPRDTAPQIPVLD